MGEVRLIAQWLATHRTPVAYVQLDSLDDDPSRCWAHIVTAVGAAAGVDVSDLLDVLRSTGVPFVTEIVEPLLARVDGHPVTLVVEDLHLATSVELEETLAAVFDRRPKEMGVAFTSRVEPPLQLARRRVRGELVEVRREDLRVDAAAGGAIVAEACGVELRDAALAALLERTEGWAAGLYLAGLSLRSSDDVDEAIRRFAGDDRNLSEYLATEVLGQLAADDRAFLVGTAVLHRLDGAICDAVLGRTGSAERLADLARSNLFLIPLDQREGRYRYHHLFREWLLVELGRGGPGVVAEANRRAAIAYIESGDVTSAIEHALLSDDAHLVFEYLLRHRLALLDSSQHATVNRWYRSLPAPPTVDQEVQVDLLRAWSAVIEGDLDTIDRLAARAQTLLSGDAVTHLVDQREGEPHLLRAYSSVLRGAVDTCRAELELAISKPLPPRAGPSVAWLTGVTEFWLGEPCQESLDHAFAVAVDAGVPYPTVLCESYLAMAAAERGELDVADRWAAAAFRATAEHNVSSAYLAGPHAARAQVRHAAGDFEGAVADGSVAVDLAERRNDTPIASLGRLVLASVHHSMGDAARAKQLLAVVEQDLAPLGVGGILDDRLAVAKRQLRLQQTPIRRRTFAEPVEALTDREMALLRMLPGDLTQRELGNALHMSFNTVKTYNRQIYRKLGVSSRDDAIAAAQAAGLL